MQSQKLKIKSQNIGSSRLRSNGKFFAVNFLLFTFYFLLTPFNVSAQTVDPNVWQQGSVGLKFQPISIIKAGSGTITEKKTGGISFQITDKVWPYLSTQGGLQDTGWNINTGPVGIEFGLIKNSTTAAPTISGENTDWARNEITYSGSGLFKMTVSRLTSAALIQSDTNFLRMFSGNVNTYVDYGPGKNILEAPSYPKYIAYSSGGVIQIKTLSGTQTALPALDNNWILVWYGTNAHFKETKVPIPYPFPIQKGCCHGWNITSSKANAYQADVPLLLTFQNRPNSIAHSPEGGIDLNFAAGSGYTSVLPIMGRDHPKASDTEAWATGNSLPQTTRNSINFWTARLCQYPLAATESYNYASSTDTATITDAITFTPVCSFSNTKFSQIPPMLGVARTALGGNLTFSPANIVDGNLLTEFGPTLGFDNVTSYSWNLRGLNKYASSNQPVGTGSIPSELMSKLKSEADKIVADGHYAPWLFNNRFHNTDIGEAYWFNPADTIYQLTQIIPVLPEPQKTNLTNYLKTERTAYPPETVQHLALNVGRERGFYSLPANTTTSSGNVTTRWTSFRTDLFYARVPLYNFYALHKYYELTGETVPASVMTAAKTALNNDMKEQDFATMYWFKGFPETTKKRVLSMANKQFQGLVGLVNLSKRTNDTATENLSRALLAKSAVFKVASSKYPGYLYSNGLAILPTDPAWQPKQLAGMWNGQFINYNWAAPIDDARHVMYLNQFELQLFELNGYMEPYTGFGDDWGQGLMVTKLPMINMVPEIWSLMNDYAKAETENYIKKVEAIMPQWYVTFSESIFGAEHNLNHPDDAYNIFLGKVYLQKETAPNLEKLIDIPVLQSGDLFYTQKLAETARVYAASNIPPTPPPSSTPPPPAKPGDLNTDTRVDIFDHNTLLTNFGKPATPAQGDTNGTGTVDIFDYNTVMTGFGK